MKSPPSGFAASHMQVLVDLCRTLPSLPVAVSGGVDYESADPRLLLRLAEDGESATQVIHRGVAAIGQLLVGVASQVEPSDVAGDLLAAIGLLLAELGAFGSLAQELTITCPCRARTYDFCPPDALSSSSDPSRG